MRQASPPRTALKHTYGDQVLLVEIALELPSGDPARSGGLLPLQGVVTRRWKKGDAQVIAPKSRTSCVAKMLLIQKQLCEGH